MNYWPALEGIFPKTSTFEPLSGGLINQVFRVQNGDATWIVKHAPPFVATAPDMPLSPLRLAVEKSALELAQRFNTPHIRVPDVLAYLPDDHVLVLEDVGVLPSLSADLEHALPTLAEWLAELHLATRSLPPLPDFGVHEIRKISQYDPIALAIEHRNPKISEELRWASHYFSTASCLTMGDLWPASILQSPKTLTVIDWEFSAHGQPEQDVAHLCAHLFLGFNAEIEEFFLNSYAPSKSWKEMQRRAFRAHRTAEILQRTMGKFAGTGAAADLDQNTRQTMVDQLLAN